MATMQGVSGWPVRLRHSDQENIGGYEVTEVQGLDHIRLCRLLALARE